MLLNDHYHLSYCTNIHPGESWRAVFTSLERYVLPIKQDLSPAAPFGIGLRLSDQTSRELAGSDNLPRFRRWLDEHGCYVFTLNGFPYGGFHSQRVKDDVHRPDWTTRDRVEYTLRLFDQLATLLPEQEEGGISTSPLSYKHWHQDPAGRESALLRGTQHLLEIVEHLFQLERRTGQHLHLDLEPEPDGLLENTTETIAYFNNWLLPMGIRHFAGRLSPADAESVIRRHINLCYDVCHFAVEYEAPAEALRAFREQGIRIGKVQISAALKALLPAGAEERRKVRRQFESLVESTYLHQVIARHADGRLVNYPDLPQALPHLDDEDAVEWRTHFHVPLFVDHYHRLQSTQDDIVEVLDILQRERFTRHLEVETYTWEVLPKSLQTDLQSSIERELEWVREKLNGQGRS